MKSFLITFDSDKEGSLLEITSPDGKMNNEIENALNKARRGQYNYITVESCIVSVDGKEKRMPSLLYTVK